jgi:hypothetical protein
MLTQPIILGATLMMQTYNAMKSAIMPLEECCILKSNSLTTRPQQFKVAELTREWLAGL